MTDFARIFPTGLPIVAAYASIRELSETEFCRLVDDLTVASASMSPSTDNPPTS